MDGNDGFHRIFFGQPFGIITTTAVIGQFNACACIALIVDGVVVAHIQAIRRAIFIGVFITLC